MIGVQTASKLLLLYM